MKGRYIVESYKQFISEYTKAKSDYDKSKAETKRLWEVVQDSVVKYRKEFIKLFNSLNPDQTYHPPTDRDDDFFLDLTFNINSKDDALSILENLILKFEDLQSDGYEMKLSVSLFLYAQKNQGKCFAEMDTDNNYFYFKDSKKYKDLFIRMYTALKPQSLGSVVTFLNKFEDILEKGEDVYTRDDDEDYEDEPDQDYEDE